MSEWDIEKLNEKLEKLATSTKESTDCYSDDYYQDKSNFLFPIVASYMACESDYSTKDKYKVESLTDLENKLGGEFDISFLSTLDSRVYNSETQSIFQSFLPKQRQFS